MLNSTTGDLRNAAPLKRPVVCIPRFPFVAAPVAAFPEPNPMPPRPTATLPSTHAGRRSSEWVRVLGCIAGTACIAACASITSPDIEFPPGAAQSQATADWDDADSAVIWGANNAEWVVAKWGSADENTRLYELRNPAGTSALLRIQRPPAQPNGPLELTASVGPIGDAAAERALIAGVERRLADLRGVEVAPIR